MEWNYWSLWPTQLLSPKSSSHNLIYILSELISQKCLDSKRQYIYSKPRKGGGWALGNCELFKRITATPTPLPPPLKNHWPPRVTRPLPLHCPPHPPLTTSTPRVSYKYKDQPGGDIHSPVSPKRGPLNIWDQMKIWLNRFFEYETF